MTLKTQWLWFLLLILLGSFLFSSCSHETELTVGGGTSPVFTVKGSAKLTSFKIFGPKPGEKENPIGALYWEIEPSADFQRSRSLGELGQIQYGVLPPGYTQRFPINGSPLPLSVDSTYTVNLSTTSFTILSLKFAFSNGEAHIVGTPSNHRNIPTH
jgi:hypothetical protein